MTNTAELDILVAAERLQERLRPGDLDSTLAAITAAAVDMLPHVHFASLTMRQGDGTLRSHAVTCDLVVTLDEQQFALQEGPCYDGATTEPFAVSNDLLHDPRYPRFGPVAAGLGISSSAGIRLFESGKAVAALNLFSRQTDAFGGTESLSRLFASHAAVALAYSVEVSSLNEALRSRTLIGQAVGIVMERYKIPEHEAFAFLTRLSQHGNVKLRRIADELVRAVSHR